MRLEHVFQRPRAIESRLGCILSGVTRADVPLGTEIWAEVTKGEVSALGEDDRVEQLARRKIGAPVAYLPTFGASQHDGTPHIEAADTYSFVVCERGAERERRSTDDLDELLFWVFSAVTFSMASDWEIRHRRPDEDTRQLLFAKQEELLNALAPEWGEREAEHHRRIVEQHPFRDE